MATQTLAEAHKLINDQIVKGVVETFITINPLYSVLPFDGYEGQAILVNRETTAGDTQSLAVDGTITAKAASAFTQASFTSVKLIGDVEMDGLVQAQSSSAGTDQIAVEIASKARKIARDFQAGMATGTGASPQMNSFHSHYLPTGSGGTGAYKDVTTQYTTPSAGQAISFALMDEMLDLVKAKDGQVDWIMMAPRTMRSYKVLLRALGGATSDWVVTLPDGRNVIGYESIPIFKNDNLSIAETANGGALTTGALTSIWAGCFDDGSRKVGIAGIHPAGIPAGIQILPVGQMETKDSSLIRIRQYSNFVIYNPLSVARLTSINN